MVRGAHATPPADLTHSARASFFRSTGPTSREYSVSMRPTAILLAALLLLLPGCPSGAPIACGPRVCAPTQYCYATTEGAPGVPPRPEDPPFQPRVGYSCQDQPAGPSGLPCKEVRPHTFECQEPPRP